MIKKKILGNCPDCELHTYTKISKRANSKIYNRIFFLKVNPLLPISKKHIRGYSRADQSKNQPYVTDISIQDIRAPNLAILGHFRPHLGVGSQL